MPKGLGCIGLDRSQLVNPVTRDLTFPSRGDNGTNVQKISQPAGGWIVQAGSHVTRATAAKQADGLSATGTRVGILRSGGYHPLIAGYYVVYVGPFAATDRGKHRAEAISRRIPGSTPQLIRQR